MTKIEKYSNSNAFIIAIYVFNALILLFTIATFLQYFSLKLNLTNPLISEDLVQTFTKPYLTKGIILLSGLLMIVALTFNKKRLTALVFAMLFVAYYIFSNHYIAGWNTQTI